MKFSRFLFFVSLSSLIFTACSKETDITGIWENEQRILRFTSWNEFELEYKSPDQIKLFRGIYDQKSDFIALSFREYEMTDGSLMYTSGTELEKHMEIMSVSVKDNILTTRINSNGKIYRYKKSSEN